MTLESMPLQVDDLLDERRHSPWLRDALGLLERDDIGRGLLNDGESLELQLAQHGGLARWCAGDWAVSRTSITHQRKFVFRLFRRSAGPHGSGMHRML